MKIDIFTDGACSGNPGIGGWGAIIIIPNEKPIYLNGGSEQTTNNQMELTAAIKALEFFKDSRNINIFTDSKYVKNGIESWIINWKKNGWKTSAKKPVKNRKLWESLDNQISRHHIQWCWIKGHAGNINNEIADNLARKYIEDK
tara:strand:- start:952 stop:1383 length:432 start_codon:yes stop_codon:yes gene_type:complete